MRSTDLEFPGLNRARFVHVKLLECLSALLQLLLYQQYMAQLQAQQQQLLLLHQQQQAAAGHQRVTGRSQVQQRA